MQSFKSFHGWCFYPISRYLEEELHLTTYIHQRDLGPGYLDQQLLDAIQDSWRLVLVLSARFLRTYEKAHLVMKVGHHRLCQFVCMVLED